MITREKEEKRQKKRKSRNAQAKTRRNRRGLAEAGASSLLISRRDHLSREPLDDGNLPTAWTLCGGTRLGPGKKERARFVRLKIDNCGRRRAFVTQSNALSLFACLSVRLSACCLPWRLCRPTKNAKMQNDPSRSSADARERVTTRDSRRERRPTRRSYLFSSTIQRTSFTMRS